MERRIHKARRSGPTLSDDCLFAQALCPANSTYLLMCDRWGPNCGLAFLGCSHLPMHMGTTVVKWG